MIRSLATLAIALAPLSARAQDPQPLYTIEGRFDAFTTDELGNVYALRGDELELYDRKGQSWLRNSVKTFGRIQVIDAFYSMKPMVFSPEQGQLAVLDNTLSVQGSVMNLPRSGFPQVVLVCMSVQNHFWFFDERDLALVRVDPQLRPVAHTGRLDQQLGFTPKPIAMQEHEGWLYVNDPKQGILVFDLFGTYARTIPITGAKSFEVRGSTLVHFAGGELGIYDMRSFKATVLPLPEGARDDALGVRIERGLLYLHRPHRIEVVPLPREP